jgi:hypothetical protein
MGEKGTPAIRGFNTAEVINAGARVLPNAVFEENGLMDFIDAVEGIRKVDAEPERGTLESVSQDDRNFCTNCGGMLRPNANFCIHCEEKWFESVFQSVEDEDTPPTVAAACPACGHTWMGNWHVSFKDRQCPECRAYWRVE